MHHHTQNEPGDLFQWLWQIEPQVGWLWLWLCVVVVVVDTLKRNRVYVVKSSLSLYVAPRTQLLPHVVGVVVPVHTVDVVVNMSHVAEVFAHGPRSQQGVCTFNNVHCTEQAHTASKVVRTRRETEIPNGQTTRGRFESYHTSAVLICWHNLSVIKVSIKMFEQRTI